MKPSNVFFILNLFLLPCLTAAALSGAPGYDASLEAFGVDPAVKIEADDLGPQEKDQQKTREVEAGERVVANASWWGFDEEDSTEVLQAAMESGARVLIVPRMEKPWILQPLFLPSNQTIVFEEGTVIEAKRGAFRGRHDALMRAINSEKVNLIGYGAIFQMHKEDYRGDDYEEAQWRHTLTLRGVTNAKVMGLTFRRSGGDGIYVGSGQSGRGDQPSRNVHIRDVMCDDNFRQGLSVITVDGLLVENSIFRGTEGHAPSAGIDLEPNNPHEMLKNVVIRNCVMEGNEMLGMHMWLGHLEHDSEPVDVLWESNYVRGGRVGIHVNAARENGVRGTVTFRKNIVEQTLTHGLMVRRKGAGSVHLNFENNLFYNVGLKDEPTYGVEPAAIALAAQFDRYRHQGGLSFANNFVYDDGKMNRPILRVEGADGFDGWTDVSGTITAFTAGGARVEIDEGAIAENFDLKLNGRRVVSEGGR